MAPDVRRNRPNDEELVASLASGASYEHAGARAGCSARTVRRRMADSDFRARVRTERSGMLDRAVGVLSEGAAEAAEALRELVRSDDDRVRLAASRELISAYLSSLEVSELAARLVALESGTDDTE